MISYGERERERERERENNKYGAQYAVFITI
jgi:hypothetical protein